MEKSFRDTASAPSDTPPDETYKRIIPNKHIKIPALPPAPAKEGQRFYFRFVDLKPSTTFDGVKFWLKTGAINKKGEPVVVPFISDRPFDDFKFKGRKGVAIGHSAAEKGCALSKLADQRHPVVALNLQRKDDKTGLFKPNVEPVHAARVQMISVARDSQGGIIMDGQSPKLDINPDEKIFEFRQSWWDKLVEVLEPKPQGPVVVVDDGMTEAKAPEPVKNLKDFMAANKIADLGQIVFYVQIKERTTNKSGDRASDIDYEFDYSEKVFLDPKNIPASIDPILDWGRVYKKIKTEELAILVAKAENRQPGAAVPAPGAGASAAGTGGGTVSADSPEQYLGTGTVALDGAAPGVGTAKEAPKEAPKVVGDPW